MDAMSSSAGKANLYKKLQYAFSTTSCTIVGASVEETMCTRNGTSVQLAVYKPIQADDVNALQLCNVINAVVQQNGLQRSRQKRTL
jgi:hypothetical protein